MPKQYAEYCRELATRVKSNGRLLEAAAYYEDLAKALRYEDSLPAATRIRHEHGRGIPRPKR